VNRVRFLGFLTGVLVFAALALPGSALAGTYTWDLATDFTATSPGANPDHDQYGATPWTYQESVSGSTTPSTFTLLPTFTPGSVASWSDMTTANDGALVGDNQPGIFVEPGSGGQVVAVGWTSPMSQTATVSINGSLSDMSAPPCLYATSYVLEDQSGNVLQSGTLGSPMSGTTAPITAQPTVDPGGSIFLAVSSPLDDPACEATALSLQISAAGTAPVPTVTGPASGSSSTVATPTFAGGAGADFGDGGQVTLRVYSGSAASGAPVQTVNVARSGATWSATLGSPLPLGTYTAQAEQDDIASPPDAGLSAPVTFSVTVPAISLSAPGSEPLTTSTPTLTGTADDDPGSDSFAVVEIYAGGAAAGSPVLRLPASVGPAGQFAVQVSPALTDGTYTAVAAQGSLAGNTGLSAPQAFSVDTQAPAVTLVQPGTGARADLLKLAFSGGAGDEPFDSSVVTVALYRGKTAAGTRLGTVQAGVSGSTWSARWPGTLRPGVYTAVASQTDVVGHVGVSAAHTFRVLPLPPVIGDVATINRAGRVSVKIACNEPAGDSCTGTVLVLTRAKFQPLAGGPIGHLTVMFAYVHILAGQTPTITRKVLAPVAAVLRRHLKVKVTISANLRPVNGKAIHATARDSLRRIGT
jgi:hypothetical protein